MLYTSPLIKLVATAVKKAANSLTRDFSEIEKLQNSLKNHREFVANSYQKIERELKKELQKVRPELDSFLISPLDGIMNFAHGIADFTISVAVCNGGKPVLGVIYSPIADELFFAEKGKGAYKEGPRNSERLRVSARKELKEALVSVPVKNHEKAAALTDGVRSFGSVSMELAYVASGKLDAVISLKNRPEDLAAGILLVKEAGGHIFEAGQKDTRDENIIAVINSGDIIAVNANLNKAVYDLMK